MKSAAKTAFLKRTNKTVTFSQGYKDHIKLNSISEEVLRISLKVKPRQNFLHELSKSSIRGGGGDEYLMDSP